MPQIDALLQSMTKFGAGGALLVSGEKVQLSFPTGKREAAQTTPHATLIALVEEIVPPGVVLNRNGPTTFTYDYNGSAVKVRVDAGAAVWRVAIESRVPPGDAATTGAGRFAPRPARSFAHVAVETAIERLLVQILEMGASDLHLSAGAPPYLRLNGALQALAGQPILTEDDVLARLYEITPERHREEFERRHDTDFAHTIPDVSRFRVNLFRDRRGPAAVFRAIPLEIPTPEELGVPKSALALCDLRRGLVLVSGSAGSGKSTTLAALIDHINRNRTDHILTIEDPIEFLHENKKCLVHQREVRAHTESFQDALRASWREDPDIILVGEMRDFETIAIAIETAQGGRLVFGAVPTATAASTVESIIDQSPADRQEQIRSILAQSLKGVISQTLCKRIGGGRVAAYEVLICDKAVADLIREKKTSQIDSILRADKGEGRMSLNDSLMALVKSKTIEAREAYLAAVNKSELEGMLLREGIK